MFVKIVKKEYNIAGQLMSDYELTFAEYTKEIYKHTVNSATEIVYYDNNEVIVITSFSRYRYSPLITM